MQLASPQENPWYASWFEEEVYDLVYQHRSREEASAGVQLLYSLLYSNLKADLDSTLFNRLKVFDCACGDGRHSEFLRLKFNPVTSLDLSYRQLKKNKIPYAKSDSLPFELNLALGDMKHLPFKDRSFSVLTSFFTSFGYFQTELEHQEVIKEWGRVLEAESFIFLDLINPAYVIKNLVPESISTVGSFKIRQNRSYTPSNYRLEKLIEITSDTENIRSFKESVRVFKKEELTSLFKKIDFSLIAELGSYLGDPFNNNAERMILLFKRT